MLLQAPRDVAALGSLLMLPRAAADTRGQYGILYDAWHATLLYTGAAGRYDTQERREEESRRNERKGGGRGEPARTAGGGTVRF